MIVPMKKVSLVILGNKKSETLKKLRKLGILQIEVTEGSGQRLNELKEQVSLLENAAFALAEYKKKNAVPKAISPAEALTVSKDILSMAEEKKALLAEQASLIAELERLKRWGEIDPHMIEELAQKGLDISLYEMPKTEYDGLNACVKTISIARTKNSVKFLLIKTGAEGEDEVLTSLNNYRFEMPSISNEEIRQKIEDLRGRINGIDEKIGSYADCAESLKKAVADCLKEIEFEVYATGMTDKSLSDDGQSDLSVAYFTGFVEEENLDRLKAAAKENAWGLLVDDPSEEDNVPTKLKNNKFVSLVYPLTDFLGTVPGYFEHDISDWFLFFILIFFGMIFGDGGYGLLVAAVAMLYI